MSDGRNLLTHSRVQCMRTCLRKHCFAYELGIKPAVKSAPLRMGSAIHLAKELVHKNKMNPNDAILQAIKPYDVVPAGVDATDWAIEREKVYRLAWAYFQVWADDTREVIATEQTFELPIKNPETGGRTNKFLSAGKIDGIVKLPDGRVAIDETKTTSKPIDPESDFWQRLRVDDQITKYFWAARQLGYDISCVIYDVIKKPTIEPLLIPLLDENGDKIVLDAEGKRVLKASGLPRQTGDSTLGYVLQQRRQTPAEYGERLSEDIAARPGFYFQRKEITRLESDIEEFEHEQWQSQQLLSDCQRTGRWFRNTGACLSPYRCEYANLCFGGFSGDLSQGVPEGFTQVANVNPELESEEA